MIVHFMHYLFMTVKFFNQPYLLYGGGEQLIITADILTTTRYCMGSVYVRGQRLAFPVFIYDCLYEHNT